MNTFMYILGALVLGLYGLFRVTLSHLTRTQNRVAELELKLKQGDADEAVETARKALEDAQKGS